MAKSVEVEPAPSSERVADDTAAQLAAIKLELEASDSEFNRARRGGLFPAGIEGLGELEGAQFEAVALPTRPERERTKSGGGRGGRSAAGGAAASPEDLITGHLDAASDALDRVLADMTRDAVQGGARRGGARSPRRQTARLPSGAGGGAWGDWRKGRRHSTALVSLTRGSGASPGASPRDSRGNSSRASPRNSSRDSSRDPSPSLRPSGRAASPARDVGLVSRSRSDRRAA